MSDLDVQVQDHLRTVITAHANHASDRAEAIRAEGRPGALLFTNAAAFWIDLLDVIDGTYAPSRDEEFVLRCLREPIEARLLAKAKRGVIAQAVNDFAGAAS